MSSSLSNLIDNLADVNCEKCDNKREYIGFRDNQLLLECSDCNTWYKKDTKKLIKRFANTYEFCNKDIDIFVLLLRKGVYPYEYMDSWERFNETSLPNKVAFYSNLNIENIMDVHYRHANSVFKKFGLKNLEESQDLYVQGDVLLLADVFEFFNSTRISVASLFENSKGKIRTID